MASIEMKPTFSIIVPVYNVEHYLQRCIESVLSQSYQNFELLLVDDGSKDKSGAVCDEYAKKDNRVRIFHKENGGVSSARNVGLDNACGEWICFVDSDDEMENRYLSKFHQDSDLEIQGAVTINATDKVKQGELKYKDEVIAIRCAEDAILRGLNTAPWAKCFRRSIIDMNDIRFEEDLSYGEDSIFIYKYLCFCSTIRYNSHIGYKYYIFDTGLGHKRHPMEKIVSMYSRQFDLYFKILNDSNQQQIFFHRKTLFSLREFFLWYDVSYRNLRQFSFVDKIVKKHLNVLEKTMLYFPKIYLKYCSFYYKYVIR